MNLDDWEDVLKSRHNEELEKRIKEMIKKNEFCLWPMHFNLIEHDYCTDLGTFYDTVSDMVLRKLKVPEGSSFMFDCTVKFKVSKKVFDGMMFYYTDYKKMSNKKAESMLLDHFQKVSCLDDEESWVSINRDFIMDLQIPETNHVGWKYSKGEGDKEY